MKRKIALFLNHHIVGGAERSGLEMAEKISEKALVDIYYPYVDEKSFELFKEKVPGNCEVHRYEMPSSFGKVSRNGQKKIFRTFLGSVISIIRSFQLPLDQYDILWMNGTKVFILLSPAMLMKSCKTIYFHLRDYIPRHPVLALILRLNFTLKKKLTVISNSNSVQEDFISEYKEVTKEKCEVLYNYCSRVERKARNTIETIAVPSMLTPWKGQHSIVLFTKLYEKKLKDIGIKRVVFYGDNIYLKKTGNSYRRELKDLAVKLGSDMLDFPGVCSKQEIFTSADLIIHSSLQREPFGRILLEGFGSGIPVISTGQGGAYEVMSKTDLIYNIYHHNELYELIEKVVSDHKYRNEVISKQNAVFDLFTYETDKKINELFYRPISK